MSKSDKQQKTPEGRVNAIFKLLQDQGEGDYIGEQISQLEHCLQAAYQASVAQADTDTIVAALLHDIGQFLPGIETRALLYEGQNVGKCGHEKLGADYLRSLGFNEKVCSLVEAHVVAKRYLCATSESYHASLSSASQKSLVMQGGPFTQEQVKEFERDPLWKEKVQLRKWDDAAKIINLETPGLDAYRQMAIGSIAA
ncbi:hypothetical protein K439DRAFT_1403062 [Ramaria rubella]|nr:hypothetical protein K439DRAFT_1403062 [Ramaria rubella]